MEQVRAACESQGFPAGIEQAFRFLIDEIMETELKSGQNGGIFMDKKLLYRLVGEDELYQPLMAQPEGKKKMEDFWKWFN